MREASSPSFFNPEEVLQVKAYVQQLLADTRAVPRIGKCFYYYLSLKNIRSQSFSKSLRTSESSRHTARNARSFARP
jgi:hypothetical protein